MYEHSINVNCNTSRMQMFWLLLLIEVGSVAASTGYIIKVQANYMYFVSRTPSYICILLCTDCLCYHTIGLITSFTQSYYTLPYVQSCMYAFYDKNLDADAILLVSSAANASSV